MPLPRYSPLVSLPEPIAAFAAAIPVGVAPFKVVGFKASLICEGSARLEGSFEPFTVSSGDLVLMSPGTQCGSVSLKPLSTLILQVHPVFLVDQLRWTKRLERPTRQETYEALLRNIRRPVVIRLPGDSFFRVAEIYSQLVFLSEQPAAFRRMIARATELIWEIEELLVDVHPTSARSTSLLDPPLPVRAEVQEAIRALHDRYASNLSIRDLAREVALSESALLRAILAETGLTPREYLHRIRLMRFEQLVAETTLPLEEASRMVGWSSTSHARSAFARSHGMSPSEYRAEAQTARRTDWLRTFGA